MSKFITAKDLAQELEMNERNFRLPRKQRELGLDECLDTSCRHPIRFHRDRARRALIKRGHSVAF